MDYRTKSFLVALLLAASSACSSDAQKSVDSDEIDKRADDDEQPNDDAKEEDDEVASGELDGGISGARRMDAAIKDASRPSATLDASIVPRDPGDAGSGTADSAMAPESSGKCLQGSGDYTKSGPYKVKQKQVTVGSKGAYTIFYPDPLESACPHPIVAWGNGTVITGGGPYAHFHDHAASWGIVTISSHNSSVGDGSFHRAGIDYLLEQSGQSDSEFFNKLSPRAGVSGHSQGGAGGDRASSHPNVQANVNVQGSFGTPPMSKAALLCLTGTEDIQPTGCPMAVRAATVPALSASWDGADHVATTLREGEGSEQYKRLYSAWFRCFLADDGDACELFRGGSDCKVCKEPGWEEIFANNY